MAKPKAWEAHKALVLKKHPGARECIAPGNRDAVYIVIGLNTVIGEGRYGSIAWANAAQRLRTASTTTRAK